MNDNAKKWVEALRSGKYKQGKGLLRRYDEFCCLGVACDLYQKEVGDLEVTKSEEFAMVWRYDNKSQQLPNKVRDWLGLKSSFGAQAGQRESLAGLNDAGHSFAFVAGVIEAEPEGLFVD